MISINWDIKIISVPQSYLTNLGGGIYELDVNQFRLDLDNLEDDEAGMVFDKTHSHNTVLVLSGTSYARSFEIINGYKVEFEAGAYTVKCTGANHNIGDVKTINSVSLLINNSAGLIVSESGGGGASVDAIWNYAVEGDIKAKEALRLLLAIAAGKTTIVNNGNGSATVTFRDVNDTENRVVADMQGSTREDVSFNP